MSYNLFLAVILLIAVILILIVMVQNPKGGGLSSSFGGGGGAQSMGGVQNTNNFLDRTTWTLAIAMFALILLSNFSIERENTSNIKLENTLEDVRSTPKSSNNTLPITNDTL